MGIAKNQFSCEYLAKYLLQWENLQFIQNPSKQINIGGIDCYYNEEIRMENTTNDYLYSMAADIRALKYLLVVQIFLLCCEFLIVKSHFFKRMQKNSPKIDSNPSGNANFIDELIKHKSFDK